MKLLTTSVVRGSQQGESHGGVYLVDLDARTVEQKLDWNTADIDWQGRGWDRGLRGIAFDGEVVYIAASDELFAYSPGFELLGRWRNPYLKHCHEIAAWERRLFLASTGYDSVLAFDLDRQAFDFALHVSIEAYRPRVQRYDPAGRDGPLQLNKLHLNNVHCDRHGLYIAGLRTGGLLHFNGRRLHMAVELPPGTHNARPFRDGVIFNDTGADALRYCGRGEGAEDRAFRVPVYDPDTLTHCETDESGIARQGFARGLCLLGETVVAGGSSPSTITAWDLPGNEQLLSVNLTRDLRNAIHGLEVWPYD